MGCCQSRLERLEAVSRCKARRRYTKQLVQARRDMAAAHALYLRALRATGASLLHFASAEADNPHPHSSAAHHHQPPPSPPPPPTPPPPPPPPPLSPTLTITSWTTNSSISASPILPPPPMPSSWDFWDPFAPSSSRSATDDADWDDAAPNAAAPVVVTTAAAAAAPQSIVTATTTSTTPSELTVVAVPRGVAGKKDLAEIATEVDEYFLKAAEAGARVTALLECPICEPPETTTNNSFPGNLFPILISQSVVRFCPHYFRRILLLHSMGFNFCCREGAELQQELEAFGVVLGWRWRRVYES
jgi:hypothetical protein